MALAAKEAIQERIKNRVIRSCTASLVAWLKNHFQSEDEADSLHQAVEAVDKPQSPTEYNPTPNLEERDSPLQEQSPTGCTPSPSLLTIPLEIRLQIFGYLLSVDEGRICPHARVPYLFIRPKSSSHCHAPNNIFLPALLINRQLYFEMKPILYSENLFYFEHCLTGNSFWPGFPHKTLAAIGTNMKQIGFSLESIKSGSTNIEASIDIAERLKAEFKSLSTLLPNLNTTRVDLFCTNARPCQRFLVCLVRSCQLLHGKKIITVHSTNREKVRIANVLRIHLQGSSDLLLLGGCICIPFLEMRREQRRVYVHTREIHCARPDRLNSWVKETPKSRERLAYESVVKYGSVFFSYSAQVKGPRIGCLLCNLGTDCVHEARYTPTRKGPVDRIGKVSIGAFEDWVYWEVKASKRTVGIIYW